MQIFFWGGIFFLHSILAPSLAFVKNEFVTNTIICGICSIFAKCRSGFVFAWQNIRINPNYLSMDEYFSKKIKAIIFFFFFLQNRFCGL